MNTPPVIYRRTAYDAPREVHMMIYQEAIQLYDTNSNAFVTSLPLKTISHFSQQHEAVTIHFKNSDDIKLVLEDDHPLLPELTRMEKKPWIRPGGKVLILTLAVIAGVILVNIIFSSVVADIGLKIITPEYEKQLGEQMFDATVPLTLVDSQRTATLQSFADKLNLSKTYNIRVTVLRAREINAYAVPGGHIVIYTGLLDKMESYDELAALLGHEVAHINERHTTRSILKAVSTKLFLIFFMDVSQVGAILLLNADKLRALSYSRSLEKEADEEGLKLMQRNRINLNGMVTMFNRLKEADTTAAPGFLNTHPLTEKRIEYSKRNIREMDQRDARMNPALQQLWLKLQKRDDEAGDEAPAE